MATYYDFGIGHVPASGDDVLFLDSNFIIAYLFENHIYHLPCANFLVYLNGIVGASLAISEISVSEVMFGLARAFYVQDEIISFRTTNRREPPNNEMKRIYGGWSYIIKNDPVRHKHYNKIAANIFKPFLNYVHYLHGNENQVVKAIELMENVPMASSDSLITATAISQCHGIVTVDGDFSGITEPISIFTTTTQNSDYNIEDMIDKLGTKNVWIAALGEDGYKSKFGIDP